VKYTATTVGVRRRPEYVDLCELQIIAKVIQAWEPAAQLELAIGIEAFDDALRNEKLNKGLPIANVENLVAKMNDYGHRLKCYMLQKPFPGMTNEEAVADVKNAIDYLSGLMAKYPNVPINMHLNPVYAAKGTMLEKAFARGEFAPPLLRDVARAVLHGEGKPITIFVGLDDEDLAVPGGSFIRTGDETIIEALNIFNARQNYAALRDALGQ